MRPSVPELAALMAARGITGKSLAQSAGISPSTFHSILHRRHDPSRTTAQALANALNVPVEKLGLRISERPFPAHLRNGRNERRKGVRHG